MRNPWRFSFDRLTGDLWIADVGQVSIEEVDFQPAASTGGENYGWRCYEGNQVYNGAGCLPTSAFSFPVYTYPHGEECSITGGFVFRGNTTSYYNGYYFFADYCSDRIWTLHNAAGTWVKENFGRFQGNNFSTFGEDAAGQLYIVGITSGTIWRLDLNVPLNTTVSGTITNGQSQCYNAITNITVGGPSCSFVVDAGGNSTMIAGQNIIFNINTTVMAGGTMHCYITPDNQFCGGALSPSVLCDFSTYKTPVGLLSSLLKVYPNPTKGSFIIEQGADAPHGTVKVEVFGILGNRVLSKEYPVDNKYELSIKDNTPGISYITLSNSLIFNIIFCQFHAACFNRANCFSSFLIFSSLNFS